MATCTIDVAVCRGDSPLFYDADMDESNDIDLDNSKTFSTGRNSSDQSGFDYSAYCFVAAHQMSLLKDPRSYYLPSRPLIHTCSSKDGKIWVATTLGNSNGIVSLICFSQLEECQEIVLECCFNAQVTALELRKRNFSRNSGELELLVGCVDGSVYGIEEVYLKSNLNGNSPHSPAPGESPTFCENVVNPMFPSCSTGKKNRYDKHSNLKRKTEVIELGCKSRRRNTYIANQLSTWRIIKFISSAAMELANADSEKGMAANADSSKEEVSTDKVALSVLTSRLAQPRQAISSTVQFLMRYLYLGSKENSDVLPTKTNAILNVEQGVTIPNGVYIKNVLDSAEVTCSSLAASCDEFPICRLLIDRGEKKELLLAETMGVENLTVTHDLSAHAVSVLRFSPKKNSFYVGRADGIILEFDKHCGPASEESMEFFDNSMEEKEFVCQMPHQKYTAKKYVSSRILHAESIVESIDSSTIASLSEGYCEDSVAESNDVPAGVLSQMKQFQECSCARNNVYFHSRDKIVKPTSDCLETLPNYEDSKLCSKIAEGTQWNYPQAHFETSNNTIGQLQAKQVRISRIIANKNPVGKWIVSPITPEKHSFLPTLMDIQFSPNNRYVTIFLSAGYIKIFTYPNTRLHCIVRTFFGPPLCCAWTHDSKLLLIGGQDDCVSVINIEERRLVGRCEGHRAWIRGLFVLKPRKDDEPSQRETSTESPDILDSTSYFMSEECATPVDDGYLLAHGSPRDSIAQKKEDSDESEGFAYNYSTEITEPSHFGATLFAPQDTSESKDSFCELASPLCVSFDKREYKNSLVSYSFASISEDGYLCLWEILEEEVWKRSNGIARLHSSRHSIDGTLEQFDNNAVPRFHGQRDKSDFIITPSQRDTVSFTHNLRERVGQNGISESVPQLSVLDEFCEYPLRRNQITALTNANSFHENSLTSCVGETPNYTQAPATKFSCLGGNNALRDYVCIFPEDYINCRIFRPQSFHHLTDEPVHLICPLDQCSPVEQLKLSNCEIPRKSPLFITLSHSKKIQYWKRIYSCKG
ncbi:putative Dystrophia myotonica WD repeat-containing protein [Cardiosporidium cionae]|uniref:Dystrophia myotonica WD repeat-containing protein n=1 Tax=Cardiosporidium cionae TaxID=476202 RepID=A0ABQ7J4X1_9APIC|nr:putative Dystrophia myotonica WD repeat-containing protein [Cardiosporidium cionae]|eukprot:KAF8819047.1 putative Dystrophia myotonica WD repeat-containing protein [Cardiosporidium cionae]